MLIWPMIAFGWVVNLLQQGAASMNRLSKILDTKPDIDDSSATDHSITNIEGDILFKNVSFAHKNAAQSTLKNINLHIKKGTTVALVGYTGSGKSTFVNLIPRLYEATAGEILIDGIDIRKIPLGVLRTHIGYVPQETFLFSDSLKENISYGIDNGTLDHVLEAAKISQIASDVKEFPNEFETMLGERGITLSGGQKQRTSIARAVMRNPKILILDDALSAVDTYTEEEILKRLREVMKNRTNLIISHRISTVQLADEIIVLNNGMIAERGSHSELVAAGGIYAELYEKQLLEDELEHL
jgi:ATP-binding cassette subfamily B multidrug efflux pump